MITCNYAYDIISIVEKDDAGNIRYYNKYHELHREDGPAVEYCNGSKAWYWNGACHRKNGPAQECVTGYKIWYWKGHIHRSDGPAKEGLNGYKEWWVHGKQYSEQEFNSFVKWVIDIEKH